jgi:hypothetical protein
LGKGCKGIEEVEVGEREFQAAWAKVVAKAWSDADFKARLRKDAGAVLKEEGIQVPENMSVKVVENSDTVVHLVLPAHPGAELSFEELDRVAGGMGPVYERGAVDISKYLP